MWLKLLISVLCDLKMVGVLCPVQSLVDSTNIMLERDFKSLQLIRSL